MGTKKKLTPDQERRLLACFHSIGQMNDAMREICRAYGVSHVFVYRLAGWVGRRKKCRQPGA
jgi:hypothetical protein